jgi:hypothetical protein
VRLLDDTEHFGIGLTFVLSTKRQRRQRAVERAAVDKIDITL